MKEPGRLIAIIGAMLCVFFSIVAIGSIAVIGSAGMLSDPGSLPFIVWPIVGAVAAGLLWILGRRVQRGEDVVLGGIVIIGIGLLFICGAISTFIFPSIIHALAKHPFKLRGGAAIFTLIGFMCIVYGQKLIDKG